MSRRAFAVASGLAVLAAALGPSHAEPGVGALGWGISAEGGLGVAVVHAPGGTSVGMSQRQGLRLDRPGRLLFRLGLRRLGVGDGDAQMNSGEREALLGFGRFTLDLGVGLRTRRRGNVTGFAVAGLAVGATLTQLATLGQPIPDDASLPTTRRHFPVVAPEVTIGAQWWPRRWISLGLAATYSPTWVHGELLHVSDTLATLALAL